MGKSTPRLNFVRAALAGLVLASLPMASFAYVSVGISVNFAPPALPVYVQPPCPGIGYIWTPGYWAWGDDDYYWVPGTWVLAPTPGYLWTPGYWGWNEGIYLWHAGYWGPHVGFYGGINYGYGYTGVGFEGGYWRGHDFYYNRAVNNLTQVHVTNVYNKTVINNVTVNRVSFNGGSGGVRAQANAQQLAAARERHVDFTSVQREHEHLASGNHDLRASVNGGKPRIAATARPTSFTGRDIVSARAAGAPYHAPDRAEAARGGTARGDRPGTATGNPSRGGEFHAGGPAGRDAAARADRPSNATGNAGRGAEFHSGAPAHNAPGPAARADRPPSAAGNAGRGAEFHSNGPANDSSRMPTARADRPPNAGGNPSGSARPMTQEQPHRQFSGGGQPGPRPQPTPRMESAPHPQMPPRAESAPRPQMTPRMESAPHPQMAPRPESAPRQQMAPRMESAPRPQAAPRVESAPHPQPQQGRPEMRRGGGEPRGEGRR